MKIDEAIKIKEMYHPMLQRLGVPGLYEADKLSIEALKARKIWQDEEGFDPVEALPGETEE